MQNPNILFYDDNIVFHIFSGCVPHWHIHTVSISVLKPKKVSKHVMDHSYRVPYDFLFNLA